MKKQIVKTALTSILALATTAAVIDSAYADETKMNEKCYGRVKAGKNDCQTATTSCAGTAKKDNQPDSFIFLPQGTCDKIVGASTTPLAKS